MFAVVRTGGKRLRVEPGDVVAIERIDGEPGDRVELDDVLLIGGDAIRVGTPRIEGASVVATIQGEVSGPKLRIFKHKRRKRYRLHKGHRQHYTSLKIESIKV
jgi:large subunit ribosomal protein L21